MAGCFPNTLELEAILRISDERLVLMLPTGRGITSRSVVTGPDCLSRQERLTQA